MEDEAAVAEVGALALDQRRVRVAELGRERFRRVAADLAVLPAQVALLARLRPSWVAGRVLASDVLVQVCLCGCAVAVLGDGGDVDVVDWGEGSWVSHDGSKQEKGVVWGRGDRTY